MSINISVGNAYMDYDHKYPHVSLDIELKKLKGAPNGFDAFLMLSDGHVETAIYDKKDEPGSNDVEITYTNNAMWTRLAGIHSYMLGHPRSRFGKPETRDKSMEEAGNEKGLVEQHPGVCAINQADADFITDKLTEFRAMNPDVAEGLADDKSQTLKLLVWLEFWMRWAVENCEYPAIGNS